MSQSRLACSVGGIAGVCWLGFIELLNIRTVVGQVKHSPSGLGTLLSCVGMSKELLSLGGTMEPLTKKKKNHHSSSIPRNELRQEKECGDCGVLLTLG